MKKIPVGATIAHAYRFAFLNFFKLLGVMWLPWAIMTALGLAISKTSMAFSTAIMSHDSAQIRHALIYLMPFYLLMLPLLFMQMTGLMELALGTKNGSPYYYFSLGKPLWRASGAFLLLIMVVIGCWIAVVLGGIVLVFVMNLVAKTLMVGTFAKFVVGLSIAIAFCAYIYIIVRSSFLLMPVVIAEEKISLKRAWTLGEGNFWRILLIFLAVLVPAVAIEIVFMFKFMLQGMPPGAPLHATPEQMTAVQANIAASNAANMARITQDWYIVYPFFGLFAVLFYGLSSGAQAFAYRALTDDDIASSP